MKVQIPTPDLKIFELLADLSDEERELVAELLTRMELDKGEQLFGEGQESEGVVFVERGSLTLTSQRGGEIGSVPAGDSIGALSLVAVGPREATAVAVDAARVWILSRESFRRLVEDSPRAACRILEAALVDLGAAVRDGLERFGG